MEPPPIRAQHARRLCAILLLVEGATLAAGHGALVSPRSRNSVDYLTNMTGKTFAHCSNVSGSGSCKNGQAAFWYSQGCFIGCPACDHKSGRRQTDVCGLGAVATLNDPLLRTINRAEKAGSKFDIYRHNPWRRPGNAPVGDACGFAGGTPWGEDVSEEGVYLNTSFAHHGQRGSTLPPLPTGVAWTIGLEAEVTWNVLYNHGGGYSYRLCPAAEPLTEACFQSHPLDFVRDKQALVMPNGTKIPINGTFVDKGTSPDRSTWSMLPLPPTSAGPRCGCSLDVNYNPANYDCGCLEGEEKFACDTPGNCSSGACLPCPETPGSDCSRCDNKGGVKFPPPQACMGTGVDCSSTRLAILDVLKVPANLPPGKYVLGWRWDCEASSQVWSNCADIELVQ